MSTRLTSGLFRVADPDTQIERALVALGVPTGTDVVHRFRPFGVSWARMAGRRRAALHTWPEQGLVTVDVYADRALDLPTLLAPLGWVPLDGVPSAELIESWQGGLRNRYRVREVLARRQSTFQEIVVADTEPYGRVLLLDGELQSAAADEEAYHQALVMPALLAHPAPRRVLVVGAGEGASAREVLATPGIERCGLVEIDPLVTEVARSWLETWHRGAFDDPRVAYLVADAREAVPASGPWDVIVLDASDPTEEGPARVLFTREWYRTVEAELAPGGVVVTQAGEVTRPRPLGFAQVVATFRSVFPDAVPYAAEIPSFQCLWGFVASGPPVRTASERSWWSEGYWQRLRALPADVRLTLEQADLPPLTDDAPIWRRSGGYRG